MMTSLLAVLVACTSMPGGLVGDDSAALVDSGGGADDGGLLEDTGNDGGAADDGDPCIETEVPLTDAAPPVSVDEVWPVVEAWAPSTITWLRTTSLTTEGESESFSVAFTQSGEPSVVTRTGWDEGYETHPTACRPGPELRIPVTAVVTVADGEAVATHVGYVDALTAEPTRIYFSNLEAEPVELSEAWLEAASSQIKEFGHSMDEATRIYALMVTSQQDDVWQPEWVVEVLSQPPEGGGWGGVLWQGATDE